MSHSLLALRHQIRYLFSVTSVGTGHQARASVVDLWTHDVCSDCVSLFPAAQVEAGTLVARSTGLRQTSSTIMLHQVADSPIIRHDVFDVGPSTPYFSSPMIIMLDLPWSGHRLSHRSPKFLIWSASVESSPTSPVSTFFCKMLSQIVASQFLALLSVISQTTYCNLDDQRPKFVSQ